MKGGILGTIVRLHTPWVGHRNLLSEGEVLTLDPGDVWWAQRHPPLPSCLGDAEVLISSGCVLQELKQKVLQCRYRKGCCRQEEGVCNREEAGEGLL